jgi:hypothetical protein
MPAASKHPSSPANSRQHEATRYGQQYRDRLAKAAVPSRRWVACRALVLPSASDPYDQDRIQIGDTLAGAGGAEWQGVHRQQPHR